MNRTLPCYLARIAVIALLLLTSCAPLRDRRTLNDMEALMPERPDSALAVLRGLQPHDLPGLHVRPLHALLLSEALDKNYIDLTDDSLALAANRWYGDHGSKLHRLKSCYYLGRIRFNAGNYAEAVICYNKALGYAEALGNHHYLGLINREIGNAYSVAWDIYHGIEFMQKSIDSFRSAKEDNYVAYSLLALARMYYKQMKYDDCVSVLNELESFSDDRYILARVSELRTLNAISSGSTDYEMIISDFHSAGIGTILPPTVTQYSRIAYVFQKSGQPDSADFYLQQAQNLLSTKSDTVVFDFDRYKIERDRGNYLLANSLLEKTIDYQDSSIYAALQQSVSYYQSDHYKDEARINALKARSRSLSFGLVLLMMSMAMLYLIARNKRQKEQIIDEIARTSEVEQELAEMKNEKEGMNHAMATLFENRLKILQTLSDQYDLLEDKKGESVISREETVSSFREKMRELRKDKDINLSMEEIIDAWKDGIMHKFREVFSDVSSKDTKMTDEDFELIPFYLSGMKQKTISFFTGYTEHSVKERKRRIRQKIEALGPDYSDEKRLFLDNL